MFESNLGTPPKKPPEIPAISRRPFRVVSSARRNYFYQELQLESTRQFANELHPSAASKRLACKHMFYSPSYSPFLARPVQPQQQQPLFTTTPDGAYLVPVSSGSPMEPGLDDDGLATVLPGAPPATPPPQYYFFAPRSKAQPLHRAHRNYPDPRIRSPVPVPARIPIHHTNAPNIAGHLQQQPRVSPPPSSAASSSVGRRPSTAGTQQDRVWLMMRRSLFSRRLQRRGRQIALMATSLAALCQMYCKGKPYIVLCHMFLECGICRNVPKLSIRPWG